LREGLLEQDNAAYDDVRPLRIETVHLEELLDCARLRDRLHHVGQIVGGELEVAQHPNGLAAPLRLDHLRDVEDRARAAHNHLVATARQLTRHRAKGGTYELAAFLDTAAAHLLATEEPLGEAARAQLDAAGLEHPTGTTQHQFGAPSSDVDQQQLLVEHGHRLQHAQMDEPRLLHT